MLGYERQREDPTRRQYRTLPGMAVPLKLELEGELDGAGAADLVERVEAAIGAAGA